MLFGPVIGGPAGELYPFTKSRETGMGLATDSADVCAATTAQITGTKHFYRIVKPE